MVRVSQPVLSMLPSGARSIGPSAGVLEGPDGGVVFVFGLATFSYAAGDEVGRRLAAVQLVAMKISSSREVAGAFGASAVTLWRWSQTFARGGVLALGRAQGPDEADRGRHRPDRGPGWAGPDVGTDRCGHRGVDRDGPGRVGPGRTAHAERRGQRSARRAGRLANRRRRRAGHRGERGCGAGGAGRAGTAHRRPGGSPVRG